MENLKLCVLTGLLSLESLIRSLDLFHLHAYIGLIDLSISSKVFPNFCFLFVCTFIFVPSDLVIPVAFYMSSIALSSSEMFLLSVTCLCCCLLTNCIPSAYVGNLLSES
jgi:hypothetical protein